MSLSGLTLEVRGMVNLGEAPSLVMLEIQSSSPGIKALMREWTSDGQLQTCGIAWIEDNLFLALHPSRVDSESLKTSWLANLAEPYAQSVVSAFGWGLQNPKSGETPG